MGPFVDRVGVESVVLARAAAAQCAKILCNVPLQDWLLVLQRRPNILLEGPEYAIEQTLVALIRELPIPVYVWNDVPARPAPNEETTIIAREVTRLSESERDAIATWLEKNNASGVQMISTSSVPLFPLVQQNLFPAELYYRLNVVRLVVS